MFILPSLSVSEKFSVGLMLQYLEGTEPGMLRVDSTIPLLYSILVLVRDKLDKLDTAQERALLNVVSLLVR